MTAPPLRTPANGQRLEVAPLLRAGRAHHIEGRLTAAAGCYETALAQAPDDAGALHLLGLLRVTQGRPDEAIALLRRAAERGPTLPAVWYNLGLALRAQGQLTESRDSLHKAVALNPGYIEAHLAIADAARAARDADAAIAAYRHALQAGPRDPATLNRIGIALGEAGLLAEAEESFRRALALAPERPETLGNLGIALQKQGRLREAVETFQRAAALAPEDALAFMRLGAARSEDNRLADALAAWRRVLALRPNDAWARSNMALLMLRAGHFPAGWREYECRWQTGALTASPHAAARPMWRGEALAGQTVLLWAEQGFGDTLQFSSFCPLVLARGARVLLQVQRGLEALLATIPGVSVFAEGDAVPDYHLQCPLLSLPLALGTRLDTLPRPLPLVAPPDRVAAWGSLRGARGEREIGVAWSGNPEQPTDAARSLPLARFRRLLELPGCRFHLLQPELRPTDEAEFSTLPNVIDYRGRIRDFADTAAIAGQLDLVIATDTSVAHLAGAMGRPVWVLLPFAADWRWLTGREDSPWYPSARLFRQRRPGDWDDVLARVRGELVSFSPE